MIYRSLAMKSWPGVAGGRKHCTPKRIKRWSGISAPCSAGGHPSIEQTAALQPVVPRSEDQQFHLALYRCAGNDLLLKLIRIFWIVYRQLRAVRLDRGWEIDTVIAADDHVAIIEALKLRDSDLIKQRIVAHYAPMRQQLIKRVWVQLVVT